MSKIKVETSYNIIYDDMRDISTGHIAHLLAKTIYWDNISVGLEAGEPFIAPLGVTISNTLRPKSNLIVISLNNQDSTKEDIDITEGIADVIQYLLLKNNNTKADIRRIKAISKGFKKTQTFRKYLKCYYVLVSGLDEDKADLQVKDMVDYGLPFYIKVNKTIEILSNLTTSNIKRLLYYRQVWGEDNLLSIYLFITRESGLPEYIVSQFPEVLHSVTFKVNLLNFGIALGKGELNKYLLQQLVNQE